MDSREHRLQDVVDDERDGVGEIKEVRKRPDPSVDDRRGTAGGRADECTQAAGRNDLLREGKPDRERDREDRDRKDDDEAR